MATVPNNILVNVQTYQKAELAWMLNSFVGINKANKKFKDFENLEANLGSTVTFDLAPRSLAYAGLQVTVQDAQQRLQSLTCSQALNWAQSYTDQQFIFNVRDYMDRFGQSAIYELGSAIEKDILSNVTSSMAINNPNDPNVGQVFTNSGPFRFFGDGITPINSFGQLAQALANFRDFGAAVTDVTGILPMVSVPAIVNSGLAQFATRRNDELSVKWELGRFSECTWYESNLLPTHISGTVGNTTPFGTGNVLTVVSTNDPTGANITQITFSGAGVSDPNAIFSGDLFQFNDGVSGKPNMRFLSFIGHSITQQPVQFRATANAASNGSGNVTVNIFPALVSIQNQNQNLNAAIQAGMQVTVYPSHRAGVIWSGNPLYMAMPQLPQMQPYDTVSQMDKMSGASLRHYWGSQLGTGVSKLYIRDVVYGATLVPENSMRLLFPM